MRTSRLQGLFAIGLAALLGYAAASEKLELSQRANAAQADQQRTNPAPGSPSGTTTIDGKYLPNPAPKFGGVINLNAKDSKPYWPPRTVPPKGAPNVVLIMTDDKCSQSMRGRCSSREN
jgi:hypothetical protein